MVLPLNVLSYDVSCSVSVLYREICSDVKIHKTRFHHTCWEAYSVMGVISTIVYLITQTEFIHHIYRK